MKYFIILSIVGAIALGYLTLFLISTAPHKPEDWHKDPLRIATCETPNCFRMAPEGSTTEIIHETSPVYSINPIELAQAFDEFALSQRATRRIAGLPPEQMLTYVQTTERIKAPDYLTIKFWEREDGLTEIAIYSRSRFGYSDMGFNEARVRDWVKALESFEVTPAN